MMQLFLFFACLYCGQSRVAAAANYSFAECNQDGNIDIVSNQPTSITCTGLMPGQNMYWSITKEGIETRIGNCTKCMNSSCPACSVPNNNYSIIRQPTNTTLRLIDNVNAINNTSVLKCSNNINRFSAVCNVIIIEAYDILRCNDNVLQLYKNGKTKVHCTGLHHLQTMYWNILYNNGTEERLAECQNCKDNEKCPPCNIDNGDYNVTREATSSVLQLVGGDDSSKDGATLKCSKRDNVTAAACKLRVSNETVGQDQSMPMLSAVGVGVGVGALVLVVVVVALVVILRRRGSPQNVDQTNHGTRAGKKVRHRELSVDIPAYDKGPDSILPIQTAPVSYTSHTSTSTSGADVYPDTEDHTYIDVDFDEYEEEEKKNSRNESRNMRRVHFCKNTPADKPPSSGVLLTIDDEHYNNAEIDFHALANTRLGSTRPDLSADADGYSHIAISSKSTHERVQDPENGKRPTGDACGYSLGSKKPSSTEDTPSHSDDYNHIAVNPKATEEHLQWGKLQRQDGCSNPPTTKTALDKQTEKAANADVYSHIAINAAVGEDMRPKSQTSAGEANVLDVDPYDRIQTPSHNDEPVLYENAFEKTAKECDDEFNRLKFSQLESKKTEDPEYSHISQV